MGPLEPLCSQIGTTTIQPWPSSSSEAVHLVGQSSEVPPPPPSPPPTFQVLQAFDGTEYGEGYLSLEEGQEVSCSYCDSFGWAHGGIIGGIIKGWYPFSHVRKVAIGT